MNTVYPIGKFIYRGQLLDYSAASYEAKKEYMREYRKTKLSK